MGWAAAVSTAQCRRTGAAPAIARAPQQSLGWTQPTVSWADLRGAMATAVKLVADQGAVPVLGGAHPAPHSGSGHLGPTSTASLSCSLAATSVPPSLDDAAADASQRSAPSADQPAPAAAAKPAPNSPPDRNLPLPTLASGAAAPVSTMMRRLEALGGGIDGDQPLADIHVAQSAIESPNFDLELAVSLSHLSAVRRVYESGERQVLILEDDASLLYMGVAGAANLDAVLQALPPDWHVVQLYQFMGDIFAHNRLQGMVERLRRGELVSRRSQASADHSLKPWGTVAYAVSHAGAQQLLCLYWPGALSQADQAACAQPLSLCLAEHQPAGQGTGDSGGEDRRFRRDCIDLTSLQSYVVSDRMVYMAPNTFMSNRPLFGHQLHVRAGQATSSVQRAGTYEQSELLMSQMRIAGVFYDAFATQQQGKAGNTGNTGSPDTERAPWVARLRHTAIHLFCLHMQPYMTFLSLVVVGCIVQGAWWLIDAIQTHRALIGSILLCAVLLLPYGYLFCLSFGRAYGTIFDEPVIGGTVGAGFSFIWFSRAAIYAAVCFKQPLRAAVAFIATSLGATLAGLLLGAGLSHSILDFGSSGMGLLFAVCGGGVTGSMAGLRFLGPRFFCSHLSYVATSLAMSVLMAGVPGLSQGLAVAFVAACMPLAYVGALAGFLGLQACGNPTLHQQALDQADPGSPGASPTGLDAHPILPLTVSEVGEGAVPGKSALVLVLPSASALPNLS